MANACGRLFNPGPNGHSPMGIDSDMLSLFKALSPLAYESLHGNEKKTTVEKRATLCKGLFVRNRLQHFLYR